MTLNEMLNSFPPAMIFFAFVLVLPLVSARMRSILFLVASTATFLLIINLEPEATLKLSFLNMELTPLRVDSLSLAFGYVFCLISFLGGLYAYHLNDKLQQMAALLYAGSALGAVFAGDLFSLFIFWELMLIGSACLIWSKRSPSSGRAGMRYILVHLTGGSFLLAGILWKLAETGSIEFTHFEGAYSYLILIGFAVNAAIPPVHAWLSDAYPKSTVTGTVFLSAFTTKVAVYTLIRGFGGLDVLIWTGAAMALYGAIYAFMQNDIRRILSYGIISQLGFMVAAVGIGNQMAINGAVAHSFSHILYKGLLFMATGAVLYATGKSQLNQLGGLYRKMPFVFVLYMIGALSISGFPLFNGFVSKSIILSTVEAGHYSFVFIILQMASVGTFLYTGLKVPYYIWFGSKENLSVRPLPAGMYAGMALTALACLIIGIYPKILYNILPYEMSYQPYTLAHLWETGLILTFTALTFWVMITWTKPKKGLLLDFDWFYRKPAGLAYKVFVDSPAYVFNKVEGASGIIIGHVVRFGANPIGRVIWYAKTLRKTIGQNRQVCEEPYDFNPHRYRTPLGFMVSLVMLAFVVIFLLSLL